MVRINTINIMFRKVKSNFRTAITVPEKCWSRFRDILNDYCEKMRKTTTTTSVPSPLPLSESSLGESGPVLSTGMLLGPIGAAAICTPTGGLVGGLAGLSIGSGGMDSGLSSSSNGPIGGGGHK